METRVMHTARVIGPPIPKKAKSPNPTYSESTKASFLKNGSTFLTENNKKRKTKKVE